MPIAETEKLKISFTEHGPADGKVLVLLHGWPDDASTWDNVVPYLAGAGLRLIVPTLRGFGATEFISKDIARTGNSGILAMDVIALLHELEIDSCMVAGHDWGANIAEALAVGWPGRIERVAMLSTPPRLGGMPPPAFEQAQRYWYHWFMATDRGAQAIRGDRHGFAHIQWVNWSPRGWFDEQTFSRVARSFDNPDWVEVTLHSYRARWGVAEPDPDSVWLERLIQTTPSLSLPAAYIYGQMDGVNPPGTAKTVPDKFKGPLSVTSLPGVGHFPQREDPGAVAQRLVDLFTRDLADLPRAA